MAGDLDRSNPRYRALIQLLRTADLIWNSSRRFFDQWELSPSQFNVLNLLYGAQGGLTQTELSEALLVHRSNITGLIDRLEKRGLLRRHEVDTDRRAYRVLLTGEGMGLMKQIFPVYFEAATQLWAGLSDTRICQLLEDLRIAALSSEEVAQLVIRKTKGATNGNSETHVRKRGGAA